MRKLKKNLPWMILCLSLVFGGILWFFPQSAAFVTNYLSDRCNDVLGLSALTAGAATSISFLPGDAGTPIADMLLNFSGVLMIILAGIMFEKYLFSIAGFISFIILIPAACLIYLHGNKLRESASRDEEDEEYVYFAGARHRKMTVKLGAFAVAFVMMVPASVGLSMSINHMYNDPVAQTLEVGNEAIADVEKAAETKDNRNILEKAADAVTEGLQKIGNGVTSAIDNVNKWINHLMEGIAVMILTSLVIPVLTYFAFYYLMKMMFGLTASDLQNAAGKSKACLARSSYFSKRKKG